MYTIDGTDFTRIEGNIPEYISTKPVRVLKEIKFDTCWDCLKKYKVNLKII